MIRMQTVTIGMHWPVLDSRVEKRATYRLKRQVFNGYHKGALIVAVVGYKHKLRP